MMYYLQRTKNHEPFLHLFFRSKIRNKHKILAVCSLQASHPSNIPSTCCNRFVQGRTNWLEPVYQGAAACRNLYRWKTTSQSSISLHQTRGERNLLYVLKHSLLKLAIFMFIAALISHPISCYYNCIYIFYCLLIVYVLISWRLLNDDLSPSLSLALFAWPTPMWF